MRKTLKILASSTLVLLVFFSLSENAKAAVIVGQTTNTGVCVLNGTQCINDSGTQYYTGATSTVAYIQIYISGTTGEAFNFILSQATNVCTISGTLATSTSGTYIELPCTSGIGTFVPGAYIFTTSFVSNPAPSAGYNGQTFSSPNFQYYFEALDNAGNTGTNTGFIGSYVPANGAYSTTSPTTFSAYYYFNCNTSFGQYDTLTFSIQDLTNPTQSPYVSPQPLGICGQGLLSASVSLNTNDSYLWRPEMYLSGTSSVPLYGNTYFFQSTTTPGIDINTAVGSTLGTSTLPTTTNLLTFLNVPQLLETKFPFAYIFQIASGIQIAISTTTYNTIPSGNFVWSGIGTGTTTFDFFSTTTIGYYLSPALIGTWRTFLVVVLYVSFGYALYERARKQLSLSQI